MSAVMDSSQTGTGQQWWPRTAQPIPVIVLRKICGNKDARVIITLATANLQSPLLLPFLNMIAAQHIPSRNLNVFGWI